MQLTHTEQGVYTLDIEFKSEKEFPEILKALEDRGIVLQYLPPRNYVNGCLTKSGNEYIVSLYTSPYKNHLKDENNKITSTIDFVPLTKKKLLEIQEFLNDQI